MEWSCSREAQRGIEIRQTEANAEAPFILPLSICIYGNRKQEAQTGSLNTEIHSLRSEESPDGGRGRPGSLWG